MDDAKRAPPSVGLSMIALVGFGGGLNDGTRRWVVWYVEVLEVLPVEGEVGCRVVCDAAISG